MSQRGACTSPSSSQPGVASSEPLVPSKSCFFHRYQKPGGVVWGFLRFVIFFCHSFYFEIFIYFPFAERKCGLFSPSLSTLVLSEPCPSAWRLLPAVKQPALSIIHSTFTPASVRLVQQKRTRATCRCERCEYESNMYEDGQKFSSSGDPCVQCRCSVSADRPLLHEILRPCCTEF